VPAGLRVGYAPYDHDLEAPGDRRRFVAWARDRGIDFDVLDAPQADHDVAVVCTVADLTRWRAAPPGLRVIYDVTDDYLGLPSHGWKNRARGVAKFLSGELSRPTLRYRELMADMCRRADVIVCTSEAQRIHVRRVAGDKDVPIILDCYDADWAGRKRDYQSAGAPRIAWEGLPFNVGTLAVVREALEGLPDELRPSIHVVTQPSFRPYARRFGTRSAEDVARRALPGAEVVLHPWERDTVADVVAGCELAIIPLPLDDRFAAGKSAQKLLSLWALGMPVVTSATPAYEQAMEAAGLDLACRTTADWTRALTILLSDENARRSAAEAGRAYVEQHASREIMLSRWDNVIG
jgi:glycosyltransferase involved in cell wall biosynthesis